LGANIYARVTNMPAAAISLYQLSAAQFQRLLTNAPSNWQGAPPQGASLVANYAVPARAAEDKTILIKQPLIAHGKPVPPGYYLVDAGPGGGGISDHLLVLITRTSATLKIGQRQAFVWATDLKSGKPVAGEAVRIVDMNGHVWATGTTNAVGIFQATVHGLHSDDSLLQHTLQAQLTHGLDVSACGLDWNSGVGPWDYNLPFSTYQQPVRIYLTTDRPIYRPGQPVYFKGIARRDNDGRYTSLPSGTPVQVQIQDARQNIVFNQRLKVDAYGAFNGRMALSAAAGLGYYNITAGAGVSNATSAFQVAAYKTPTYNVMVISDRGANANYVQGQRIGVQVHAHYYFGAPVAHAPVKWDLTQDDFSFSSTVFPDYNFVDYDYATVRQQTFFGQQVTEGTGATDAQGDFHFSVPAAIAKNQQGQQFTLEAIVTGPDNEQVAERTQVVVHKAALYVGLRPANYLGTAGARSTIDVVTVSDDGTRTIAGVPVTARIYKRVWFSGYVRDANGFYYFQDSHKDTLVATVPVRTNAQGRALVTFTPRDGGEYRIVATATDSAGRTATTAAEIWVASAQNQYVPWQTQNNDRIQLVADKKAYQPGETAHLLVTAPLAGMTALITVERGGVLTHRVTMLRTNSTQIGVPILGYYAPDVYVSVTLVKGPGADTSIPVWKMGYVALPVDTAARSLHVALSASVPKAAPGQKITFTIHATNARGQGVHAQLAVSLVDKAVLALAQNSATGLMDTFYQQRDLGVESAATLNLYIDRLNLNQQVGSKGGSGGGGGAQGPTRQKFPDTAYWNPSVITNARGDAQVTITLPDNLTTWTFSAIGGTTSTLVGQQTMDLISSKDLLLEPALPRFLTVGDSTDSGAVVTNLTGAIQSVRVTLHVSGAGAPVNYTAMAHVPSGQSQLVTWPIRALALGTQTYLFTAQAAGNAALGDRLQVSVPVQVNSIPRVDATSGLFRGSTTQTVQVPAGVEPNQGGLTIDLAPSLVSGLGAAASFLVNYPYDCAEQTTSRYYGLLEATRLPPSVSGVDAGIAAQVPAIVQTALQQLYTQQNDDGGWGWWPEDQSSPYMTAYVLEGLIALRGHGYTVDARVLTHAAAYLRDWALNPPADIYLPNATSTLDLQAYSAYVLGEAGSPDSGLTSTLYTQRQNMLPFARAYLALAIGRLAGAHDPRVHNLLAALEGAAQQFDAQAHWSDKAPDWIMMEDDTSATAVALDALVRLDPGNPLVPGAVRWLMTQRIGGAWGTTQSTALALRALADYAVQMPPLSGTARFTVTVNGKVVGSGTITDANRGTLRSFTAPLGDLGKSARVTITRQGGSGQMAYTVTLRTYQPITSVPADEHGILVTRRYEPVAGSHRQAGSELR
ncbi:MAG TPA: MG2 domain-containing protein, partial [Chloroflexota bacterium]|nr:MG2 domain-containing protein [Chloroflexota bacterium]